MKRATFRRPVELQVVQKIIDDFSIVEADFGQLATINGHDLMNMAGAPGIAIVHVGICGVAFFWVRRRFDAAQRGVVAMHANPLRQAIHQTSEDT